MAMPSVGMKAQIAAMMIMINTSSTVAKLTCSAYNIIKQNVKKSQRQDSSINEIRH